MFCIRLRLKGFFARLKDKALGAMYGWRFGYKAITRCALTKFHSRQFFELAGRRVLEQQIRRNQSWVSVIFMDVNRLKLVNDALSHAAGDLLLATLSYVVSQVIRRENDQMTVRWGGDEVALFLPGAPKAWAEEIGAAVQFLFKALVSSPDMRLLIAGMCPELKSLPAGALKSVLAKVGVSLGVVAWESESSLSLDQAIALADQMMYRQKKRAKAPRPQRDTVG